MVEKQRPEWWPPNAYWGFRGSAAPHMQGAFDEGIEAGVKAVIERITDMHRIWGKGAWSPGIRALLTQLREEAGL